MTGPLFTQFELQGVNALTAGSFDASTSFDANMPASHVIYSLGVFDQYFSPEPNSRPNAIKVNAAQDSALKKCDENSTWFDRITGRCCIGEVVNGECRLVSDGQGGTGGEDPIGKIGGDLLRRVGLLLLALVLIAVALWKM